MIGEREVEVPRGMNGKDYLDDWYANNELESDEVERIRRGEVMASQEDTAVSKEEQQQQRQPVQTTAELNAEPRADDAGKSKH